VKVSVEKLPTSEAVLEVDVTWEEMEKASDKAYRRLVQQVDIQGFRKGKAPRSLLERRLGKEYIYQEGLEGLISEAYRRALKEHDLTPITQPKLDIPAFEIGQPYHFSVTIPIITPVVLGDYRSLHFDREEVEVTSEEVEKDIESQRSNLNTWQPVERPAHYDDRVAMDLRFTAEGQTISDLKDNPFELTNERYGIYSGMDEHILGMQVGESKSFSTTIPNDYSNEKLAGKQGEYQVTLHKVEEKQLPPLDDAWVEKITNGKYQTLEDLRKSVSDRILEDKKRRAREELQEKIVDAVVEQSQIVLHSVLIEEEIENAMHRMSHLLQRQHLSLEQYLMIKKQTLEQYKQSVRPDIERSLKQQLVLSEVARQEHIEVTTEEVDNLFQIYTQLGQQLPRTDEQRRALEISYRREKTISRLVELTAGPDPDAESEALEQTEAEETAVANAEAAAVTGEIERATSAVVEQGSESVSDTTQNESIES
jgi:trigger factor